MRCLRCFALVDLNTVAVLRFDRPSSSSSSYYCRPIPFEHTITNSLEEQQFHASMMFCRTCSANHKPCCVWPIRGSPLGLAHRNLAPNTPINQGLVITPTLLSASAKLMPISCLEPFLIDCLTCLSNILNLYYVWL